MQDNKVGGIPLTFWLGWAFTVIMSVTGAYMTTSYASTQVMTRIAERVNFHDVEITRLRDRQDALATKQDLRELRLDIIERLSGIQESVKR